MKKLSLSLLAALCLLCSCAGPKNQAQNQPQNQAPVQTKKQDIIKLLDLMEIKSNLSESVNTMLEYTLKMGHGAPSKFFEYIKAEFKYDKFIEMYIAAYDKIFSDEEIKELIKFYENPLGKKLLQTARLKDEDSYRILEEAEAAPPDSQIQPKKQDMIKLFNLTIEPVLSAIPDSGEEYKALLLDKVKEAYVAIYDKFFSDEDIKELIKFYESSVGKKELQIISESSNIAKELGEELYSFLYANIDKASNFTFDEDEAN
jgi:hypothetical protein